MSTIIHRRSASPMSLRPERNGSVNGAKVDLSFTSSNSSRSPGRRSPSPSYGYRGNPNVSSLYPGQKSSIVMTENRSRTTQGSPSSVERRRTAQRIVPKHEPVGHVEQDKEVCPDEGALQFVPAFEESASVRGENSLGRHRSLQLDAPRHRPTSSATSWDAIADEEKKESLDNTSCLPGSQFSGRHREWKRNQHSLVDKSTVVSPSSSPTSESGRKSGRMGRIASLFSSRAVVRSNSREAMSPLRRRQESPQKPSAVVSPPSPTHSSGSSGYVGWPGTQDRQGATVTVQSSYDDSSTGGQKLPLTAKQQYERELQEAAEREMARWTGGRRTSLDDYSSSSFSGSPERQMDSSRQRGYTSSPVTRPSSVLSGAVSERERVSYGRNDGVVSNTRASPIASRYTDSNRFSHRPTSASAVGGRSSSLSIHNLFPEREINVRSPTDPWGTDSDPTSTSPGTSSVSKTSSAYLQAKDFQGHLDYPHLNPSRPLSGQYERTRGNTSVAAARSRSASPRPPTEEDLATNDMIDPPHRPFPATGYRGLIDKTKDVPSLMDDVDSDSMASSKATSTFSEVRNYRSGNKDDFGDTDSDVFDGLSVTKESDVFDNLSSANGRMSSPRRSKFRMSYPERIAEEGGDDEDGEGEEFKLVMLGGGLTAIQTTSEGFLRRKTASEYDENLSNSDVDQYGFTKTPGFNEMLSAGISKDNSLRGIEGNFGSPRRIGQPSPAPLKEELSSSSGSESSLFTDPYDKDRLSINGDLSEYYIPASEMKKVLRVYRKLSLKVDVDLSLAEYEKDEDEHKAFALFEMRSRVMEKDIERGLERCGGTVVVDDLVTTQYNKTAHRVRDAVIVAKAWRDGASPKDVINTAILTRRDERTYFIKRPLRGDHISANDNASTYSARSTLSQRYFWEPVTWVDDTDFMLYRCPSLGPRHMRGFEMFTIGDCQSILLKLTNERCLTLRSELNEATRRQIEAEDLLADEGDAGDSMMTEAEMTYLTAMEDVKTISKQLVCAEQAFTLIRDRIEKLVRKYEQLLSKIEAESFTGASSVVTYESSYFSEHDTEFWEDRERAIWARRAQRAEVKAELAAREALLARQEARMIQEEKQREVEALQQKLMELQSESSFVTAENERSAALARSITMNRYGRDSPAPATSGQSEKERLDNVKQRFRDRMAARKNGLKQHAPPTSSPIASGKQHPYAPRATSPVPAKNSYMQDMMRSAGEEMYVQLDFYERSLKAVDSTR